jgi:hypothetical protein
VGTVRRLRAAGSPAHNEPDELQTAALKWIDQGGGRGLGSAAPALTFGFRMSVGCESWLRFAADYPNAQTPEARRFEGKGSVFPIEWDGVVRRHPHPHTVSEPGDFGQG